MLWSGLDVAGPHPSALNRAGVAVSRRMPQGPVTMSFSTTRAGLPMTTVFEGTSRPTTEFPATITESPTRTPGSTMAP